MTTIVWFREDLRLEDHSALVHAMKVGLPVIGLYLFDPHAWLKHDTAACRINFNLRNLSCLQRELRKKNIPLLLLEVKHSDDQLNIFEVLANHTSLLCFNNRHEINEQRRDASIEAIWLANGKRIARFIDHVLLSPGTVLTKAGQAFSVFTPYKNAFIRTVIEQGLSLQPLKSFAKQAPFELPIALTKALTRVCRQHDSVPLSWPGIHATVPETYWPGGEAEAQLRLSNFIKTKITAYQKNRDYPSLAGTSQLSPYLAAGVLSPRQCLYAARCANDGKLVGGHEGIACWINELLWREFYQHVLWAFPRVSMHQPFKLSTLNLAWNNNEPLFSAWCEGRTGLPLIDAAMRQLQQTGWMHNRLRMVVAMFLTKHCFIDWRWGERFFMQHLIDGDLAANNGGWQWSASTGTDAVPYFRIFNPVRQSQRFDPEGHFIRQYCPELASLDNKWIHTPWLCDQPGQSHYPLPIVDLVKAKAHALAAFKALNAAEA